MKTNLPLRTNAPFGLKIKHLLIKYFFLVLLLSATEASMAQLVTPFTKRFQVTQKGGIVYLANVAVGCSSNPGSVNGACKTAVNEVPPNGTGVNNNFNQVNVDIDNDPSTFQSSSDSLALPNCSQITWAGLYWAAMGNAATTPTRNNIKIKVNNGAYQSISADASHLNTAGYTCYDNFKNITSIVKAAGPNARFTVADIPFLNNGTSNNWGNWQIVVVYGNQLQSMRQLTVFDGLASVSSGANSVVTVPITGFLTPPSGPVSFELGAFVHDGDRGYTGDQMLFQKAGGSFINISDALSTSNDIFNSTVSNNGVLTPYRIPNLNNTLGLDADIYYPNNTTFNYLGNSNTSATLKFTTGGETYLVQEISTVIDVYEPDIRVDKKVFDRNGNDVYMATVNPGDTLTYKITVKNIGSDKSINSFITDTIERNSVYVPNSMKITYGPNMGSKTDASSDDQASYNDANNTIKINVGTGATSATGGQIINLPTGADSTVITFKVTATNDCFLLKCDNQINNSAFGTFTGQISGNTNTVGSNPNAFDSKGCPISGATTTFINVSYANCVYPPDSSMSYCSNNIPTFASAYTRPGYTLFKNSLFSTVTSPNASGVYYAIRTAYSGCTDTVALNVTITTPNAGVDQSICQNATATMAATGTGAWSAQVGNPSTATITSASSATTTITGLNTVGTYHFIWTTNGCSDTAAVVVNSLILKTTNISICSTELPYTWKGLTFNAAGSQTVVIPSSTGCDTSSTLVLTVTSCVVPPVNCNITASIVVNQIAQCVTNNNYAFTGNFTGGKGPYTYLWDLNDGFSATTKDVSHSYAAFGEHDVTFIVKDANGCEAHASTVQIYIGAKPVPSFDVQTDTGEGDGYTFVSTSTITGGWLTYNWDLGNGTTSTLVNPGPVYYTPGTYIVKLKVIGNFGCVDSISKTIIVTKSSNTFCVAPVASFTVKNAALCLSGNNFIFTNTSTGTSPTYTWDYNDVSTLTTTATTTSHTYSIARTFNVMLTAVNSCGTTTVTKTIIVNDVPATPSSISGATSIIVGSSTTFSSATPGGVWSSNNAAATVDVSTGLVTGVSVGSATITYAVTNTCGTAITTKIINVTAACTAPVASFTINNATQCLSGNSFTFTNTSTGTAPNYKWDFNDGTGEVVAMNATHSYTSARSFNVMLTAVNSCGTTTKTQTVIVSDVATTPTIYGSSTVVAGSTIQLSSTTSGGIWSSNNAAATVDASTGLVTGVSAGSASITYSVNNPLCGISNANKTIIVTAACIAPVANFTVNNTTQCLNTNSFAFTNTSTGTIPNYKWDFNDGTAEVVAMNATHSYTSARSFNVMLIAVNSCGTTTKTQTVVVSDVTTTPTIYGSSTVFAGSTIQLSSATSGGVWSSNNAAATINASTGLVTGVSVGSATVTYAVTNTCGISSATKIITVTAACIAPVANFTVNNSTQCLNTNSFAFTNTSTGTIPNYKWDFNDGTAEVVATNAVHSYTSARSFNIMLTAVNACGSTTITKTVTVNTVPATPSSISGATTVVAGSTTQLSSATSGGVWSSNNAAAIVDVNTGLVTGVSVGSATVTYTVTNTCGSSSVSQPMTVTPACTAPVANFTINNATQCLTGNNFIFTNISTGTAPVYAWYFGDGVLSNTMPTTSHSFTAANSYTITLTAYNNCGNTSITKTVTVNTIPATPASINGTSTVTVGATTQLSSATLGGVWSSNSTTATVNPSTGLVTGVSVGSATITYTVSNACGSVSITKQVTVTSAAVNVFPNPSSNSVIVSFTAPTSSSYTINIVNSSNAVVSTTNVGSYTIGSSVATSINISSFANGTYFIVIRDAQGHLISTTQVLKN